MLKKAKGEWYIYTMEELRKVKKTFPVYVKAINRISLRLFCFVYIDNKRYLVDTVTGSMYSTFTGECMSTTQLKLIPKQVAEQV
jgi:hypothetical protein